MAERNMPASAFDAAFAELDAALIDLDGDGRPDVAVPQQPRNALLRGVPDYGFGPVTPMSRDGYMPQGELRSYEPSPGESAASYLGALGPVGQRAAPVANALLNYGPVPAQAAVEQFDRAGTAVADAYNDPSLANVTNAGAQSALAVGRPVAGAAILGAGMLEGARRDFAPDIFSPANALTRKQTREQEMRDREAARQREAEANRIRLESEARRAEADAAAVREAEAERKRKEQEEYNRAIGFAETARDSELERRHSFEDTNVGKIYRETGGAAPFLLAAGLGGFARAGLGGNALGKYVVPAAEGALTGTIGTGLPLVYDAYMTPAQNPEKAAYQAYARELPPSHPRKQEFTDYARSLPEENPVRPLAREELRSPSRMAISALEGAGSGVSGATVVNAFARGGNALLNSARRAAPVEPAPTVIYKGTDKLGRRYHADAQGRRVPTPSTSD
jgi:hypothetical protein